MSTVLGIRESEWERGGEKIKTYWIALDDRPKETPCYDAKASELKQGDPLPEGWEVKQSKAGKDYLSPPRAARGGGGFGGGGAAAFRNTAEGQRAEQLSIHRSVALTQAVAAGAFVFVKTLPVIAADVLAVADEFYDWLSQGVPAASPSRSQAGQTGGGSTAPASPPPVTTSRRDEAHTGAITGGTPGLPNSTKHVAAGDRGRGVGEGEAPAPRSTTNDDDLFAGMDI